MMGIEYMAEKTLPDGAKLRMKTWQSDIIRPGQQACQLDLVQVCGAINLTTQFPIKWENYTEKEIRDMYEKIATTEEAKQIAINCGVR